MIYIIFAALLWGITNPFLKHGAPGLDNEKTLTDKIRKLLLSWQFVLAFGTNQLGSLFYYFSMGKYPLSLAVTVVNALTLIITTLTSYIIGESRLTLREFSGLFIIVSGIILCQN